MTIHFTIKSTQSRRFSDKLEYTTTMPTNNVHWNQCERKDASCNQFYNRIELLLISNQHLKHFFLHFDDCLLFDLCNGLGDFPLPTEPFHDLSLFALCLRSLKSDDTYTVLFSCDFSFFFSGLIRNVTKPNCITALLRRIRSYGSRHF